MNPFTCHLIGTSGTACFGERKRYTSGVLADLWFRKLNPLNLHRETLEKERKILFPTLWAMLFLSIRPISLGYKKATPAPSSFSPSQIFFKLIPTQCQESEFTRTIFLLSGKIILRAEQWRRGHFV